MATRGKNKRWSEVAEMARRANGAWRLHSDLAGVTTSTHDRVLRRVRELRPTAEGRFGFTKRNLVVDEFGDERCDLYVRYEKFEENS